MLWINGLLSIQHTIHYIIDTMFFISGGHIITCFKEAYLFECPEYKKDIEGRAYKLEEQGLWMVVERKVVPNYLNLDLTRAKEGNGVTFVFKVL